MFGFDEGRISADRVDGILEANTLLREREILPEMKCLVELVVCLDLRKCERHGERYVGRN